jgi:hypothetical protein
MKGEQISFLPPNPEELHKQVEKELGRVQGEDWEDFQALVRYEVNARLQEIYKNKPRPRYEDIDNSHKPCYK